MLQLDEDTVLELEVFEHFTEVTGVNLDLSEVTRSWVSAQLL